MHPMIQRLSKNCNACELCGYKDERPEKPGNGDHVLYIHHGKHKGKYICRICLKKEQDKEKHEKG